jgi:zinc protease
MLPRTIRYLLLPAILFISVQVLGQFSLTAPIPVDPKVKIGKLSNGLTYYIRQNKKPEKKVELRLVVNAGSILENPSQQGLAHFMEHMSFNGSKHFPKNQLVDYLQKVGVQFGADLNAYTSFDETVYILPISTEDPKVVDEGFTVLEDWAGNNLLDKSEINKERGVVLEESRLSKGAGQRMQRKYFPRLFNGSLYAERLPIGKDSILKTFTPAAIESFYKTWYRPDLQAIIVVGDLDPAVAEQEIKKHFSGFHNPANEKLRPSITQIRNRVKPEAMVVTDEEQVSTDLEIFNFIRPAKQEKTWGDYRTKMVNDLMSSLINQRLQELTQKENPPFIYGYTGLIPFMRGHEAFISYASLGNAKSQDAINALIGETERARKYGFLASELERAKSSYLNNIQTQFNEKDKSESSRYVESYVNNFLQHQPVPSIEERYAFAQKQIPTITLEEINQVARTMPSTANAFALLTAPAKTMKSLPTNSDLLNELVAANKQQVKPYTEKAVAKSLMPVPPVAGTVKSQTSNQKLGTTDMVLSNGVTITLKPTTLKNDQVTMDAWRKGGFQKFTLADKSSAKNAAVIVNEMGVASFSPTDLEKFLSGKTVEVTPYINDYEEGIEGSSSVKDFETFLQLVNLYLTKPRKDETLFHSFVNKQKSQIQFLKSNPRYYYQDTLMKILYGSNPWAQQLPTEAEYSAINLDRSFDIYQQVFGNEYGMHYTFVGNIDPLSAKPLLEKYLGSLPAHQQENTFKDNGVRPVNGVVEANIKKGKEPQSIISIIFSGNANYTSEENMRFRALVDVLNIKIIEKLREEMSGIYGGGLGGNLQKRPVPSYMLQASLPCGPENVDKLTTALFDIIRNAQTNGVSQVDLDKVKETWKKQYETNLQNNEFWLTNLSNAWINETDPENILTYMDRVNALTVQDVQNAAKKYFDFNQYVKVVLYPETFNVKEGVIKKQM